MKKSFRKRRENYAITAAQHNTSYYRGLRNTKSNRNLELFWLPVRCRTQFRQFSTQLTNDILMLQNKYIYDFYHKILYIYYIRECIVREQLGNC